MNKRRQSITVAAALLAATAGAQSAGAAGAGELTPQERHILVPIVGMAQNCLRYLAPLSQETAFYLRTGRGSIYMSDNADAASMTCSAGERYGTRIIRQRYPNRTSHGRLGLVLGRFDTLFRGGVMAGHYSTELVTNLWMVRNTALPHPDYEEMQRTLAQDVALLEVGLTQAKGAQTALHPEFRSL